jgi:hypothetical protein
MQVFIKITPPPGSAVGPNFSIVPNIGTSNPSSATLTQLIQGITVTLSNPSAESIILSSLGTCGTTYTINLGTTTTTTSTTSSSTTTTTTADLSNCRCYKLTNTQVGINFAYTYNKCDFGNITEVINGAGEAGSIIYICSLNLPSFTVPLGSTSVIVEEIDSANSEIVNCASPCYSDNTAVVVERICKSSVEMFFNIFKETLPGLSLDNPIGPQLLKTFLSFQGQTRDHCIIPGYEDLCDIACSPLFLGGIAMQQLFVNSLTPENNCYSSDLGDCCWVHVSPPSDINDYCFVGGINYTDQLPASCYECIPCPTGVPGPECTQPFCISNFGARIHGNCEIASFLDDNPLSRNFTSTLLDIQNELSVSQWQDILDLHIIESGTEISYISSILTQFYTQLNGLSATLKYEYLKAILEVGLIITHSGWGECTINFKSVDSYLLTNNLNCTTTTTSSTSTTTTSSTTTTTTCQCNAWDITISQTDLDNSSYTDEEGDAIPGSITVSFKNCDSLFDEIDFEVAGSYPSSICSCCTPSLWYFDGENYIESTLSTATSTVIDCSLTTTTTILPCQCISITGIGNDCPTSEGTYTDCDGNPQSYFLPFGQTDIICAPVVPGSKFVLGGILDLVQISGEISINEDYGNDLLINEEVDEYYRNCPCAGTTTTTTSTSSTTTTTTCNCFVTSVIVVNTDCGDCEEKLPAAVKYTNCEGAQIMEQVPSGIITTLESCAIIGSITAVTGSAIKGIQEEESCCNENEE